MLKERIQLLRAVQIYEQVESENPESPAIIDVIVCGRIMRQNLKGKIYFAHIEGWNGACSVYVED